MHLTPKTRLALAWWLTSPALKLGIWIPPIGPEGAHNIFQPVGLEGSPGIGCPKEGGLPINILELGVIQLLLQH